MKSTFNLLSLASTALLLFGLSAVKANANDQQAEEASQADSTSRPIGRALVSSKEVRATVTNVDDKNRKLTLQTEDGKKQTVVADDNIKNFKQIRKGDTVVANYTEALVVDVSKGDGLTPLSTSITKRSALPGGMPAGSVEQQVNASVVVSAVNKSTPSITFKDAAGDTKTMKVDKANKLEDVKVGDRINITYSEALAVRVEKPRSQKKS